MIAMFVVTTLAVAVAVVSSAVAWRIAREDKRRSEARVQALAADLHDVHDEPSSPVVVGDFFLATASSPNPSPWIALAIGGLVVGSSAAALVALAGGSRAPAAAAVVEPEKFPAPLELAMLEHEHTGDRLIVRGVVRRPKHASSAGPIAAVVSVLDRSGVIVATGRGPVEIPAAEGRTDVESNFIVTIVGAGNIDRYRLRFSSADRTLAHVDRRDQTATVRLP